MKSGRVVLGILVGAAAGAIVGILFAPYKGSKTRKKILGLGEDFTASLTKKYESMSNELHNKYNTAIEEIENLIEKGNSKFNEALKEIDSEVKEEKIIDNKK